MAKYAHSDVIDGALNIIKNNAQRQVACSAQPTTYYEAVEAAAFAGSTAYSLGDVVRPATRNGFVYEVTTAGTTDAAEPSWPTSAGQTVVSGTVTFTCRVNYALADVAMASGDFTLAAGDTSGRKVTVGAKSNATIDYSGTANHSALIDDTNKRLLYVTTTASLVLTAGAGNTVSFPAWDAEIAAPA